MIAMSIRSARKKERPATCMIRMIGPRKLRREKTKVRRAPSAGSHQRSQTGADRDGSPEGTRGRTGKRHTTGPIIVESLQRRSVRLLSPVERNPKSAGQVRWCLDRHRRMA
jgi:hypothetical protein